MSCTPRASRSGRRRAIARAIDAGLVTFTDGDGLLARQWDQGSAGNVIWLVRPVGLPGLLSQLGDAAASQSLTRVARRIDRDLRVDPVSIDRLALAPVSGQWQPYVQVARTGKWLAVGAPLSTPDVELLDLSGTWSSAGLRTTSSTRSRHPQRLLSGHRQGTTHRE
jgi:hypothetical protein